MTTFAERPFALGSVFFLAASVSGCFSVSGVTLNTAGSGSFSFQSSPNNNVMQITVDGSLCSAATTTQAGYFNKPCAQIAICQPGTDNCQFVSDVLIDTGSYGLRIFPTGTNADGSGYDLSSLNLSQVTQSGAPVADCAQFLDGAALWGPVVRADVILVSGGERATSIPVELIESTYGGTVPTNCDNGVAAMVATDAGYNAILGIGQWQQDCGAECDPDFVTSVGASGLSAGFFPYYTCPGGVCAQALVSIANQVTNPVSAFPVNNNGVIIELPQISPGGAVSVNGSVVFGIGTGGNPDNQLSSNANVYYADASGTFSTAYNGITYSDSAGAASGLSGSFIDSGSNSLDFTPPTAVLCCQSDGSGGFTGTTVACTSAQSSGFICSDFTGSATNEGVGYATGSPMGAAVTVSFDIANFFTLASVPSLLAFSNVGSADEGCSSTAPCVFDFGLPFFYGRNIYVGFQNISGTTLIDQPYWAY